MTEKTEMDMYDNNIDTLNNELNQAQDPSQVKDDDKMSLKKEEEEIQCLNEEHTTTQLQARRNYDQRFTSKQELEENYERQIKTLAEE